MDDVWAEIAIAAAASVAAKVVAHRCRMEYGNDGLAEGHAQDVQEAGWGHGLAAAQTMIGRH